TGAEVLGLREEGHQRDETAVTAAIDPEPLRIDVVSAVQVTGCVYLVLKIAPAHVAVDRRPPVAAVAVRSSVIEVDDGVTLGRQELVEHVLPGILRPEVAD